MAATTGLAVEVAPAIWTARLRADRVAIFPVNGSKISNAAALAVEIASGAVAALVVTVLVEVALAGEAALAGSVAAGAVDANYLGLECPSNFQYKRKSTNL